MRLINIALVVVLTVHSTFSVDKNNFKTCEQSGFCKRLRNLKPEKSQYTLNLDSVFVHGNVLSAEVITVNHDTENKNVLWHYALKLSALVDGTFRVEIDEAEPLYPRYRTQLSLDGEPKPDSLKLVSKENGQITVSNSQGYKVVIRAEPLKFTFLDKNGEEAVVLNDNAQLFVEPLRVKNSGDEENAVESDEGAWSESFKSHHDSKPRGNEAVSLDVAFPDADQVYGIPEHTDKLNLATTTSGEPYRLYNLDVFEFESKRTVGVFWHNSAETWVDIVNYGDETVVGSLVNLVTGGQKRRVDARYFTWDPIKFPHPAEMVANLTAKGRKMVVIIDPHIKREAGYFLHEDATEMGLYVKNKDGKDYDVPMCLSLATAGVSFCGSDVGGFFKYPDAELMTRWYQAGAFQAFFRAHSHIETKRREPWLYDATTLARIRDAVRRRYALLDFWYTLFYEHSIDGLPVTRPLFQQYPQEQQTYTIDNTYLLDPGVPTRRHHHTTQGTRTTGTAEGTLYIDDGETFDYKSNKYIYAKITFSPDAMTYKDYAKDLQRLYKIISKPLFYRVTQQYSFICTFYKSALNVELYRLF
ncbi:unnamed protein product, partial [Leptidea sinapis]